MRKKLRRFTVLGIIATLLIWLGVQGGLGDESDATAPPDLASRPGPAGPARPDAETAALNPSTRGSAALADLFWGKLQKLQAGLERGDLQAAWRARREAAEILPELPAADPEAARYHRLVEAIDADLRRRAGDAQAQLALQRVLAAEHLLRPALSGDPELRASLSIYSGRDLDLDPMMELTAELPALPVALPPGSQVRMMQGDKLELGQVIRSSPRRATLRLRTSAGLLYPEVEVHRLGLVDPSAEQALDQSLRCLHAGDALLAVLWLRVAQQLGAGSSDRARAISACLGR